jgi:nucleotide-binding universal stress UspA family protein
MESHRRDEKTILLGTDFGPGSQRAQTEALRLAELLRARLHIVHICHTSPFSLEGELARVGQAASRLEALRARAAERVPCETHLHTGDPLHGLLGVIDRLRPGLVIIGSNGHGVLRRSFLGSLSEQLRWRSPVRVMVVPPCAPPEDAAHAAEGPYLIAMPTLDGVASMQDRPPLW